MVYTIVASVCGHPIRQSSTLPWSGSTYDFDVRYCSDLCARGLPTRTENRAARAAYEDSRDRYERRSISRDTHRDTTRRYDASRAALEEYNSAYEAREERARVARGEETLASRGRRFAGLDDPAFRAFREEVNPRLRETAGVRVRIEDPTPSTHRRESRYRDQPLYRRSSRDYEPGRYADRSGNGFYDTSGMRTRTEERAPTRRRSSTVYQRPEYAPSSYSPSSSRTREYAPSSRRVSTSSSQRSDAYLDALNDSELEERRRRVERALSRYR